MRGLTESGIRFDSGKLLYMRIADRICEYIKENEIKIGEKIPSERVLSTMLGVSRNSVREAIRELGSKGILQVEAGRGSFLVGEVTDQSMLIRFKKQSFFELFEVKTVLERHAIERLTGEIKDEQLDELEEIACKMVKLSSIGIFPQKLDDIFHEKLLALYWNKAMIEIVRNLILTFAEYNSSYFNTGFGIINDKNQSILDTIPLHLKMIECMKKRDVNQAVQAYDEIVEIDISIYSRVRE